MHLHNWKCISCLGFEHVLATALLHLGEEPHTHKFLLISPLHSDFHSRKPEYIGQTGIKAFHNQASHLGDQRSWISSSSAVSKGTAKETLSMKQVLLQLMGRTCRLQDGPMVHIRKTNQVQDEAQNFLSVQEKQKFPVAIPALL